MNRLIDDIIYKNIGTGLYEHDKPTERELNIINKNFYFNLPDVMQELTIRQKDIIAMYYGAQKSQSEIAQYLKISQSSISVHISQGLEKLANYYQIVYHCTLWCLRYATED